MDRYVSFELAKSLKKTGFERNTFNTTAWYNELGVLLGRTNAIEGTISFLCGGKNKIE